MYSRYQGKFSCLVYPIINKLRKNAKFQTILEKLHLPGFRLIIYRNLL